MPSIIYILEFCIFKIKLPKPMKKYPIKLCFYVGRIALEETEFSQKMLNQTCKQNSKLGPRQEFK